MPNDPLALCLELAKAHVSRNDVPYEALPNLLRDLYSTIVELAARQSGPDAGLADTILLGQAAEIPDGMRSLRERSPNREANESDDGDLSVTERHELFATVAPIKQRDISDPVFQGIDPWLAQRISPSLASRLNRDVSLHPTVFPDHLICLEDGASVKLLRSYVQRRFNLKFSQYIEKWNLPENYPPASPNFLAAKSAKAKEAGLGIITRAHREKGGSDRRKDLMTENAPNRCVPQQTAP